MRTVGTRRQWENVAWRVAYLGPAELFESEELNTWELITRCAHKLWKATTKRKKGPFPVLTAGTMQFHQEKSKNYWEKVMFALNIFE